MVKNYDADFTAVLSNIKSGVTDGKLYFIGKNSS